MTLLLLVAAGHAAAQSPNSASGTVKDENGEPVIGAQVRVQGTTKGTVTNYNGAFELSNVKKGDILEITFIGMETKVVKAGNGLKIRMSEKDKVLDEVMVVAFGQQTRSSFTGSAGIVKSDQIATRQVNNAIDAINGQVAGVQMTNSSGDPNSTPSIRIRGISSINADLDPLIVVNGAPYYGMWSDINPADIESMTVLKDAASTALYGARGANGVIMITTKKPVKGKTTVTVDAKWGASTRAARTYDVIENPGQYYETYYKALYNYYTKTLNYSAASAHATANATLGKNASAGGLGYIVYDVPENQYLIGTNGKLNPNATLGKHVTYNGQDYLVTPDNWIDEAYRTTLRQEYNINLSGGKDDMQFYLSLGYLDNPGIAYGSGLERYTGHLDASYKAYDWLKVGSTVNYAHSVRDYANTSSSTGTFYTINRMAPIYPVYMRDGQGNIMTDANGRMYDYGDGANAGMSRPFLSTQNAIGDDHLQTKNSNENSINLYGYAEITPKFVEGLKLTLNATVNNLESRYTTTSQPFYGWGQQTWPTGYVYKDHSRYTTYNYQQLIDYTRDFGLHSMKVMLGHEHYRQTSEDLNASGTGMFSYWENQELSGTIKNVAGYSYQTKYNTEGWFIRGQYDYNDKYYGDFHYRRDASSRFHPDHRWGDFYSFSGSWILTKEKWMEPYKEWLNMLKVKASVGQVGNDGIGDFLYTDTYNIVNSDGEIGLTLATKGNKNITWETKTSWNFGVEFELFKSRLRGELNYFHSTTTDMLCFVNVPASEGYSGYYSNIGDMVNKGIEVDLSYDILKRKDLRWTINLNATHYNNEITKLYDGLKGDPVEGYPGYTSSTTYYGEGLPIYEWYLPKYAGVNEQGQATWYVNQTNEDGTVTKATTTSWGNADYYLCGDPHPDLYGGFGTSFEWKGLDFGVNFTYSLGGKVYDNNYALLMGTPYGSSTGFGFHKDLLDAWTETNTSSSTPRLIYGDEYANGASDRWLTDGSYLRLQSITLGYTLPKKLTTRLGVSKLRFYATADNVFLWSKRKGLDPSTSSVGSPSGQGYSSVRAISGGVTLQF